MPYAASIFGIQADTSGATNELPAPAAALACLVLVGAIVWKIVGLAGPSFDRFGLGFVTARAWDPVKHVFGALPFIYGTAVSSLVALVIATPLAIAIGLYLSELAP